MPGEDRMGEDYVLTLQHACPDAQLALGSLVLGHLRMRKSGEEIEVLKRSGRHADQAMRDAWAACRVGATEREVADAAAASFARSGSEGLVFTGVASGRNGASPHHPPAVRGLRDGDPIEL